MQEADPDERVCAQADGLQLGAEQQHLKRQEAALAERLSRLEVQVWASPDPQPEP